MSVNIIAYRVLGLSKEDTFGGRIEEFIDTERYTKFDSFRYSGDKEFISKVEFIPHPNSASDFEDRYYRPKDFLAARNFINSDEVPECNRPRLLTLIDDMEKDQSIYLLFSW